LKTRTKFVLIALATGIPALLLTPVLFPVNPAIPMPNASLLPHFLVIGAVESLFFGFGIAFILLGLPAMRRVAAGTGLSPWPPFVAISFLTASWWPHLGFHRMGGLDPIAMLQIDYAFHIPYVVSAVVVAWFFFATSTTRADAAARATQPVPAAA
jgi:hypothetical protein